MTGLVTHRSNFSRSSSPFSPFPPGAGLHAAGAGGGCGPRRPAGLLHAAGRGVCAQARARVCACVCVVGLARVARLGGVWRATEGLESRCGPCCHDGPVPDAPEVPRHRAEPLLLCPRPRDSSCPPRLDIQDATPTRHLTRYLTWPSPHPRSLPPCLPHPQAGARLCKCLGPEFIEYLPLVMPSLLASAQADPDVQVGARGARQGGGVRRRAEASLKGWVGGVLAEEERRWGGGLHTAGGSAGAVTRTRPNDGLVPNTAFMNTLSGVDERYSPAISAALGPC